MMKLGFVENLPAFLNTFLLNIEEMELFEKTRSFGAIGLTPKLMDFIRTLKFSHFGIFY